MILRHSQGELDLSGCRVMGILNRTPDSFYDGGRMDLQESVDRAVEMAAEGADLIDLGAVKAGPGVAVGEAEEIERLVPLVAAVADATMAPLSVETTRPEVARMALGAGAAIVNDVSGLAGDEMLDVVASTGAALVLMHHGGQIRGRPRAPRYEDVVAAVVDTWRSLAERAAKAGIAKDRLIVDAGLDFGKTTYHSLELIRRIPEQLVLGHPLLVAASRKDVVGETLDLPVEERLEGSLVAAGVAAYLGASIVRVHDVGPSVRAVQMAEALAGRRGPRAPVRGFWD